MRLNEILSEAITNRPRNIKVYLTNRVRDLDAMAAKLEQARALVAQGEDDGHSVLRSALRYGAEDDPDLSDIDPYLYVGYTIKTIARFVDGLRTNLQNVLTHGTTNYYFRSFMGYALSTLRREDHADETLRQTMRLLPGAEKGLGSYGYEFGNPEHEADPEFIATKALLAGVRLLAEVVTGLDRLRADLLPKLEAIEYRLDHTFQPEKYRPQHAEEETLYHATAFATEIVRDGFAAERPADRQGVGSFGIQPTVSFTHDLDVARTIMRSLKEVWMIAHGEVTGAAILGWARTEGIEDDVRKNWASLHGGPLPLARGADPAQVAKLYNVWLWFQRHRTNPVFTSIDALIPILLTRRLSDIGVLACRVRLTGAEEYMDGEREFRLPADQVLSVKRVL